VIIASKILALASDAEASSDKIIPIPPNHLTEM